MAIVTVSAILPGEGIQAQQVADTSYQLVIEQPAYAVGTGPLVAIDGAHLNFHTASGAFQAFARLLERDGCRVRSNTERFTIEMLNGIDVLVIANALHPDSEDDWDPLPNRSAFDENEIGALEEWIAGGGSLMLIADHMPIAGHAEALAAVFGIRFQNGFAVDSLRGGQVTFRRSDGSLASAPVTDGRAGPPVDSVTSFTGQAFRVDPGVRADPLLIFPNGYRLYLPRVAWDLTDSTPQIPAAHLFQGVLVRHGEGRVAAFGEAAMFTAQLGGPQRLPVGMNHPVAGENYRFTLNVLAWLTETP